MSVTDTVHIVGEPVFTGDGTRVMLVVVERALTVMLMRLLVQPVWDASRLNRVVGSVETPLVRIVWDLVAGSEERRFAARRR